MYTGAVVPDMTPNYLCSPRALHHMASSIGESDFAPILPTHRALLPGALPSRSMRRVRLICRRQVAGTSASVSYSANSTCARAGTPAHFRLMILLRDPMQTIISSYKTFIHWGWVRSSNLSQEVETQLSRLRRQYSLRTTAHIAMDTLLRLGSCMALQVMHQRAPHDGRCNETLYDHPRLVGKLPPVELVRYFSK